MKQPRAITANHIFWHLLFLDAFILFIRWGGQGTVDLVIHSSLLALATLALVSHPWVFRIKRGYLIITAAVLALAMLQWVPLPAGLFATLAPIKHRIVTATAAIFPSLTHTTEITMIPELHGLKLALLALDCCLVLLLLAAPACNRGAPRFWLLMIGYFMGILATLQGLNLLPEEGFLASYRGTLGGLVNPNHYSVFAVVLMTLCLQRTISLSRTLAAHRRANTARTPQLVTTILIALHAGCILFLFTGFRFSYSRSGIVFFVFAPCLFFLLSTWQRFRGQWRHYPRALAGFAAGTVLLLLVLPLGEGVRKFAKEGLSSPRTGYLQAGLSYLTEGQVLGTGLGSCESILDPVSPKDPTAIATVRRLHNDYIQVLLESGILGFGLLIWFLVLATGEFRRAYEAAEPGKRLLLNALATAVIILALHSIWAFPLRMNAIRTTMLLLVFHCIQSAKRRPEWPTWRPRRFWFCLLLCIPAMGYFIWELRRPMIAGGENIDQIQRSYRYGRIYDAPFFVANEIIARCFEPGAVPPDTDELAQATTLLNRHLHGQPYNIKSLTLLLIAEIETFKLTHTLVSRSDVSGFVAKARAIRALGKDANIHSRTPLIYVFSQFEALLTAEEQAEYGALVAPLQRELQIKKNEMIRQRKRNASAPD